ncbi:MAG: hypothetical protein KF802_03580 [Bdellovibrionaceae bacterium]|nr:hypothetical protein [Pseudobdellovibrionaceae bacterium]MBX3033297.1 hypothetical protein [Pseudobdellovibrionaceae bacterium]
MFAQLRQFIRQIQAGEKLDLPYIMQGANPGAPLAAKVDWAASLVEWIRSPGDQKSPTVRVRFILQLLERQPEWKSRSALVLRSLLRDTRHVRLYTEVGLPSQPTFTSEFRRRLFNVFVPHYEDPENLVGVQEKIFYQIDDATWVANLPEDLLKDVVQWLRTGLPPGEELVPGWRAQVLDAMRILSARSLAIAYREDVALRAPEFATANHPLSQLHDRLGVLRGQVLAGHRCTAEFENLRQDLAESRRFLQAVRSHLEQFGVSVDLVFQMDRIRNDLVRLSRLMTLLETDLSGREVLPVAHGLWFELLRGQERDSDFNAILRKNFGILSRKIVERTGHTGEHYITHNRKEYYHMLILAGGGGALTAVTAFLKYLFPTESWPLFFEFLFQAANYSLSFLLMHFVGFKLATKQPSMTAAALAGRLKDDDSDNDREFVDEIARISRSQFAAVLGNILFVIPVAYAINAVYIATTQHNFLSAPKAFYFLGSIHPLFSATILFASLTGLLLWLSSMIAGWVENASVYGRLPDILRTHPLMVWIFGEKRTARIAESYIENISGVVSSISLGVLLAATPVFGKFFGIPLNAHHVTLSTGAATYSMSALGWSNVPWETYLWTGLGIMIIALLNFGVSFMMALMIALRARDLSPQRVKAIFRQAGRRLLRSPGEFFLPKSK